MPTTTDDGGLGDDLPDGMREHLVKIATPAHVARYVTARMPPEARWQPARHLDLINTSIVDACTDPVQRFLNVAVAVRSGKSEMLSRYLPFWYLGLFPHRQAILVSYSEDKAAEWGEATRTLMAEWGPELFGLSVDSATAGKTLWKIKGHRGGLRAVGVEGALTGAGGDLIVIDDPLKNQFEADSPTRRRKMREWYDGTLRSRLMQSGTMILTMARWHEDDLAGSILSDADELGDQWEQIRLPAIAAPTNAERQTDGFDEGAWRDQMDRKVGEPLWPEMWPLETLERIKVTLSKKNPRFWDAQYQQDPTPAEGNVFKLENWRYIPHVDRRSLRLVRFWDTAASENAGDWTVGMLVGMDAASITYVLEMVRFRKDPAGVERELKATAERDGKLVPVRVEQERAGAGKTTIANYRRLLVGWDFDGVKAEGTKEERANPIAAQQIDGRVFLVGTAADWTDLTEEARTFPNGRHDDIIDSLAGAFNFLADGGSIEVMADELLDVPWERMLGYSLSRR